ESASKNYPEQIIKANTERKLTLLTQTKDKIFVIYQPKPETESGELPYCYTYVIAATDVSLITVRVQSIKNEDIKYENIPR
ncbi:MAG: hypothetical protein ABWZ66_07545, partial [Pyrinomonadaceae bacterium]